MDNNPASIRDSESISLSDKFEKSSGPVFMTGVQALVRMVLEQGRLDNLAGLNTAGFVSGYRGSPLGDLDMELWSAGKLLNQQNIRFQPAVNEELAATAIVGTQQVGLYPGAQNDGVFSLWYGKGVGADRASDAMKHANLMGSSPRGGVVVVVGDDHGAKSSATAHQCDQAMESWLMPFFHPADFDEYINFGLLGFAMSRFAGCYVGLKVVSETVEAGAIVVLPESRPAIITPDDFDLPPDGLNIRWPDPQLQQEARHYNSRLKAAQAFARANKVDQEIWPSEEARIGIVTVGKAHGDFLQALEDLGLDEESAKGLGIALYKVGMPWPLEPTGIREFAEGLDTLFVIEEKRNFVEKQVKDILFNMAPERRPVVMGKEDAGGETLLSSVGQLASAEVARALGRVIPELQGRDQVNAYYSFLEKAGSQSAGLPPNIRIPHYCAGCPHSISTKIPEGSRAHAGTGCHLMAAFMNRGTTGFLQMGGDGINWTGEAPFCETRHVFQNMGDGTYFHSGSLAIRQAIAARVNMTFKILFNDAVAMTGGQPFETPFSAADISRQVHAEGVRRIAVVYDRKENLPPSDDFAPGATFHPRHQMDDVQRELREIKGVSIIIYVQPCAAELRRKRRRGEAREIQRRVFINTDVCEGCGDCSVQSSCPALSLIDTPTGRKRQIDQSMCNGDLACMEGLCPAFVSVDGNYLGAKTKVNDGLSGMDIPLPAARELTRPFKIVIAGVGGNGIITVGHILAVAALHEGKGATTLNFTGLSQKGGGVISHVQISARPRIINQPRIPAGGGDLLLAGDQLMACSAESVAILNSERSAVVANTYLQTTAGQIADGDVSYDEESLRGLLVERAKDGEVSFVNATRLAVQLTGQSIAANMFLLGFAFQKGHIPLLREAILKAIELNGVMIDHNTQSFEWGRLAAHDPEIFEQKVGPLFDRTPEAETLNDSIERLSGLLEDYQDKAYSTRFLNFVERVRGKEQATLPGSDDLTRAVASSYARLLAYKDEYEVARLHTKNGFAGELAQNFEGPSRLSYHLAPDLISKKDPFSGRLRKREYGPWMNSLMKGFAGLKGLRGTPLDFFSYTAERKNERALIREYEDVVEKILAKLSPENYANCVDVARSPEKIRGFGIVKQAAMDEARKIWQSI